MHIVVVLRAALHYGGEVHGLVKKFQPKILLFEAKDGMPEKMKRH